MATLRSMASRRFGSAAPSGPRGFSKKSTLQSTIGSSACGRSYWSTDASDISEEVAVPHRCRHGSPRCERPFISTRSCSLACSASARLDAGVAYGSCSRWPSRLSSERSAQLSKSFCGVKPARRTASARASARSLAMLAPACTCEALTHSLARSTMTPRAMPVSVVSREPSEAPRAERDFTVSNTLERWCRERKLILPDCSACR